MFEIEETVAIRQSIEVVWDFVNEVANEPLWQTTLSEVVQITDGPLRAGSRVRETRRFLGRRIDTVWEMTENDAPSRSSIRSVEAPFAWSGIYLLEAKGEETRFTIAMKGDPGGFFRLAEPVVHRMVRRELAGNLANLKDVLEAAGANEAPVEKEALAHS